MKTKFQEYAWSIGMALILIILLAEVYLAAERYDLNKRYAEQIERLTEYVDNEQERLVRHEQQLERHDEEWKEQSARHDKERAEIRDKWNATITRWNDLIDKAAQRFEGEGG